VSSSDSHEGSEIRRDLGSAAGTRDEPAIVDLAVVCPRCREVLEERLDGRRCPGCLTAYPVVAGILDLRLRGDAYLTIEEDRRKAEMLDAVPGSGADLLRAYWRATPQVPVELADFYVQHALEGAVRAGPHLDEIGACRGTLLDIGCGTGGLLVAAFERGLAPVGVDLALRWLVVAKRLLAESGSDATLIAADGGNLPFGAQTFDFVTCIEVLEHSPNQRALLHRAFEAAKPTGVTYLVTANRFSIAPDPTVGLWGLGFLPHRLAVRYVARRRQTRYGFMRPRYRSELRAMLGPGSNAQISSAPLPTPSSAASGARIRLQVWYEQFRRTRLGNALLVRIGPFLEVRQ
jgi:SAM-dependent methyltransferase